MGASLDFDGSGDVVSFGDIPAIDDASDLTVMAWVNMNALTQDGVILASRNSTTGILFFMDDVAGGTSNAWRIFIDDGTQASAIGSTNSAKTQWQCVAFTFSAGISNGLKLYIDFALASQSNTTGMTNAGSTNNNIRIGRDNANSRDLNGKIAYVQVWDRVLSLEEIQEAGRIPGSVPNGLVADWRCWDDAGNVYDLSGNGYNSSSFVGAVSSNDGPPIFLPSFQGLNFPSPAAGGGTVHNLTLTETITLSDDIPKEISRGLTETINLSDSIQKTIARSLVESLSLSDSIIREITRKLTETLVLSDTDKKEVTRKLTETISLSDSVLANLIILLNLTETISLTDSITKETVRTLNEAITLSDLSSKSITRRLSEVVSISDSLSAAIASLIDYIEMTSTSVTVPAMTGQAVAIADFYSESISNPDFVSESLL